MPHRSEDLSTDAQWWNLFDDEDPKPARGRVRLPLPLPLPAVIGIACTVCVIVIGVAWWLFSGRTQVLPATPIVATSDSVAEEELWRNLPSGYRSEACHAGPAEGVLATLTCGSATVRGGPASASFSLVGDQGVLRTALDDLMSGMNVDDCPGRIQSPGPWRTSGSTGQNGMLACGTSAGVPIIAWTDHGALTMNVIRADRRGPTIDELFRWWGSQA